MWMFPRNIRKISPWKICSIASLLQASSGSASSQNIQNELYTQLANLGVKTGQKENGVPNPGGMRTYFAQLACLGLFWRDTKNDSWETTLAGDAIISANNPMKVLRCQLLRMQYPSVYGNGPNVRISPKLKVKPFCFLVRLLQDNNLDCYLTSEDIAIAVIYGRTVEDYAKVVSKILQFRRTKNFESIIDSPEDLCTPRRWNDPDLLKKGVEDAQTIGNTAKNYLEATQLIVKISDTKNHFMLNPDKVVIEEINGWLNESLEATPLKGFEARWQLRYGRYDKTKDTRNLSKVSCIDGKKALIRSRFISELQEATYSFNSQNFCIEEAKRWGMDTADIANEISPLLTRVQTIQRETVMDAALSGGKEALTLEKAVTAIFSKLGFDLSEHIGQKKPTNREGGFPDIRISAKGMTTCGFGDSKATVLYKFPLGDTQKLASYYHDCWNEFSDKLPPAWFLYIAGGFERNAQTVERKLKSCSKNFGHPVSAITVSALLDLIEMENPPSFIDISDAFAKGLYFTSADIVRRASDNT